MIIIPPPKRYPRKRGTEKPRASATPPVGPLTLVAASLDVGAGMLSLTFGRAVDVTAVVVDAFTVRDGDLGMLYIGVGPVELASPATVTIGMTGIEEANEPGVWLEALPANGVVAAGDGASWAGVEALELPFP